jgi:molybdopterin-containing oxidoreductase family iron-sulfur binding subunit
MSEEHLIDLDSIRERLASAEGPEYWRSLEEVASTREFGEWLHREFPSGASEWLDPATRRTFLKLMGASLALAGATACTRQPPEQIVPYVRQPEEIVPGKPLFFATAMPMAGVGTGLLVESHMGRPTKVEGNPDHPGSLGATDLFHQASILGLYDPDRSKTITYLDEIRPWGEFLEAVRGVVETKKGTKGAGLRFLTESTSSPTLAQQFQELLGEFPAVRWHRYEPVNSDAALAGATLAFGEPVEVQLRVDQAAVILALDADLLCFGPAGLRHARAFAARRRVEEGRAEMNRLYVVEPTPTSTGASADHRLSLSAGEIKAFAMAVAQALGVPGGATSAPLPREAQQWIQPLARDLQRHPGASLVVAGAGQPPEVHAIVHGINERLGNVGKTVFYTEPIAEPIDQTASLRQLLQDVDAGQVDALVMLDCNPAYTTPADLRFADRVSKIPVRMHLGLYRDETAALSHWHVPGAHYLETWSDVRSIDGTTTIIQPLIAPLYGGKTIHEVLNAFSSRPGRTGYDIVREYWMRRTGAPPPAAVAAVPPDVATGQVAPPSPGQGAVTAATSPFERFWRKALHDGVIPGTEARPKTVSLRAAAATGNGEAQPPASSEGLEIVFRPDPTIFDGRFANNAWLQELPKPLTTLTWDNVALVSPALAQRLGVASGDVLELEYRGRTVQAPAWIKPGQARESVTVFLGYGRTRAGRLGSLIGYNAYAIRTSGAPWFDRGLEVRRTGARYALSARQHHQVMEGRALVRTGTLDEYRRHPHFAQEMQEAPPRHLTLYPEYKYEGYKWGMAIDLNNCVGCNACVIACQAENNIPVVGKREVARGHEMHWLRVDRYYSGPLDDPRILFQPVPCMHCENAPCEVVCPVAATVHSPEGLNDMIYNRCVGTRYCSNNCPYKVRRFNFLLYQDWNTPSLKLARNPEVTVRSRGVMEKCTYCVQRIEAARIESEKNGRRIRDGEVVTACQAVCPAEAIVFGDLNDPQSRVAKLQADARNYALLGELNTRPRTTYLAGLRNPNPEMPRAGRASAGPER